MLSIEEGKDYEDVNEAELPYTLLRNLGHGHSGNVEAVKDEMTKRVFARKTIHIPPSRLGKQERLQTFRNEVAIIRGLARHRHVVSVFATYATKRHFGLILQPVASHGDLEDFLGEYWSLVEEKEGEGIHHPRLEAMALVMQRAFGCLALALAFIHEKKVRHKDIKPRNILIHEGLVLYTDFGYSFDSNAFSRSTTEGRPSFLTRKYSAPEVLEQEKRNSKSDVFSLGCVFIDLLYALTMIPEADLHVKCYAESIDEIHKVFESAQISSEHSQIWTIIKDMILQKDSMRLNANQVIERILVMPNFFCVDCQSGLMETPRSKHSRELDMGESELTTDEQDLITKKRRIKKHSVNTYNHSSDTSDTPGAHHRRSARIMAPKDDNMTKPQSPTAQAETMMTKLNVMQRPVKPLPSHILESEARDLDGEMFDNDDNQPSQQTQILPPNINSDEEDEEDVGTMVEGEVVKREDQEEIIKHDLSSSEGPPASTSEQTKHITMSISSLESLEWTWSIDEQKYYRLAHDEQGKEHRVWARIAPSESPFLFPTFKSDQYSYPISTFPNPFTTYDGSSNSDAYALPDRTHSNLPGTFEQMDPTFSKSLALMPDDDEEWVFKGDNVSAGGVIAPWYPGSRFYAETSPIEKSKSEDKDKKQNFISDSDCWRCREHLASAKAGKHISRHQRQAEKCKIHSKKKQIS